MKIEMKLKPWVTPNFVILEVPARPRQEGWKEAPSIPLAEVDVAVLSDMCDAFRAEVFKKAGKPDPTSQEPGGHQP